MKEPLELEWCGGAAEKHFRRLRPEIEELPWGTLEKDKYPIELVEWARVWWTQSVVTEYRAALAFAELLRSMLEARVPLDLVGMASEFVADELTHVEISSRLAMELGGGAPLEVDTTALLRPLAPELDPLQRVNEQMLWLSSIHEVVGSAMVTAIMRATSHPLMRAVEKLIARDEARHTRLGGAYFEWAGERLDDAERARLAKVAMDTLEQLAPAWRLAVPAAQSGYTARDLAELGRLDAAPFTEQAKRCIRDDVIPTLARLSLPIPQEWVERLLA